MARKFAREEILPAAAEYDRSGEVSIIYANNRLYSIIIVFIDLFCAGVT